MLSNKGSVSFGTIVAIFGSILIALGVVWLIAQNWHQIPPALKITILVAATGGAYTAGTIMRVRKYGGIGKALLVLGALLYTWSIFLIAQIFSTSTSFQGTAWLLLLAWVGVSASAYLFNSAASLVIALIEFINWITVQYLAFFMTSIESNEKFMAPGILAFYFLAAGMLFYGLSLWHRLKGQAFARLYQWWTAFYLLFFCYILSSQTLLPFMWPKEASINTPALMFLTGLGIISMAVLISGIFVSLGKKMIVKKEVIGVLGFAVLLAILIGLTSLISEEKASFFGIFGESGDISPAYWALWILINIVFILSILAVIFYGTWQKLPKLINLGIFFFALEIITRYLGFIMDLWGYTSLSIVFITGGSILLVGGWLIEKWRRKLIARAK